MVQFLVPAIIALCGLAAIASGLLGRNFHWKPLGSEQVGPRVPGWFARPFLVLIGIAFLAAAVALWHQE
jgi:hypothetical protein